MKQAKYAAIKALHTELAAAKEMYELKRADIIRRIGEIGCDHMLPDGKQQVSGDGWIAICDLCGEVIA